MKSAKTTRDYDFWSKYPGIVWSNPDADDSVMISNALLQARSKILAAIAQHFGWSRLAREWQLLKAEVELFPMDLKAVITSGPKIEEIVDGLRRENGDA